MLLPAEGNITYPLSEVLRIPIQTSLSQLKPGDCPPPLRAPLHPHDIERRVSGHVARSASIHLDSFMAPSIASSYVTPWLAVRFMYCSACVTAFHNLTSACML